MVTSFVPLRCRSNYSFLHGAATLDRLLERAARQGMASLGLADLGGLYGAIQFYKKAKDYSIKPIVGVELETEAGRILFIAKSIVGYGNLCRLSTIEKLDERVPSLEDISLYGKDVIAIVFDVGSIGLLHDIFGRNLYFGLVNFGDLRSKIRLQRDIKSIGNIKTIAANPVAFLDKEDYSTHRVLRAIGEIIPIDQLKDDATEGQLAYFRSRPETLKLFADFPDAIKNTLEIAEECNLDLPIGKLNFPIYESGADKPNTRLLYELASDGLHRRYPKMSGEAISRLEYELNVIERAGFVDYFLIVRDIIEFCQRERYPLRGARLGGIVDCLILPGDNRGLPDRTGPLFPALPQRGPPRSTRYRSRFVLETS